MRAAADAQARSFINYAAVSLASLCSFTVSPLYGSPPVCVQDYDPVTDQNKGKIPSLQPFTPPPMPIFPPPIIESVPTVVSIEVPKAPNAVPDSL